MVGRLGDPAGGLVAGVVEHQGADLGDQAALLGQADELVRRAQPVDRVLPADERLGADRPAAAHVDQRLVDGAHLTVADRRGQLGRRVLAG